MPDPLRQTISATESPALWNLSPYTTRWMLWQRFAKGVNLDSEENSRMSWGKKLQPLIIQQAAEDLKFEVIPNDQDTYVRRGLLGCTRDATIICPDRGPGALTPAAKDADFFARAEAAFAAQAINTAEAVIAASAALLVRDPWRRSRIIPGGEHMTASEVDAHHQSHVAALRPAEQLGDCIACAAAGQQAR